MTALRQVIREKEGVDFPSEHMMTGGGRSLLFEEEEIEDLADMQYGNRLTFALLSLLFPFIDLQNSQFHVDHVFPAAHFTKRQLVKAGVSEESVEGIIRKRNGLANLQLLQGILNLEKSAKLPSKWLAETYCNNLNSRQAYQDRHLLGEVPESIVGIRRLVQCAARTLEGKDYRIIGAASLRLK